MERHLHLVPAGGELADGSEAGAEPAVAEATNVVDLERERQRRRSRYHPAAGKAWLDELFDDDDPLGPVC